MPNNPLVFALVTFLHDLFTAVWIGGLIVLATTVMPATLKTLGRGGEAKRVLNAIQTRLSRWVYVSIVGLAVTGMLLGRRAGTAGLFQFGTPYQVTLSIKHLLYLLMIALALVRSLYLTRPTQGSRPSPITAGVSTRERISAAMLMLNMALGIVVLLLSSYLATLSGAGMA
ncbi:MAG: CopD family protein [Anaerolineae bacterium]